MWPTNASPGRKTGGVNVEMIKKETMSIIHKSALLENKLRDALNDLPDNPKIERLNHNCFIMSSKDLSNKNWSVEYYDFKRQYREIIKVIDKTSIDRLDKVMSKIIKTGIIEDKRNYHNRVILNPSVVEFLRWWVI